MAKFNRLLGSFVACAAMLGGISTPASAADINIIPDTGEDSGTERGVRIATEGGNRLPDG